MINKKINTILLLQKLQRIKEKLINFMYSKFNFKL